MSEVRSHLRSLERSHWAQTNPDRPRTFTMLGREWDLLDQVFAPVYSPSTGIALNFLGLTETRTARTGPHTDFMGKETQDRPLSLLEIGCGAGVISVQAALAGWTTVAADINAHAVENTRLNALRHGVADRVTAVHSDLFTALDDSVRFDRIFWSSNYVRAPEDYAYRSVHERAYVDPGYRTHRRFLAEAVHRLTDDGCVLLHFSDRGDLAGLTEIAAEYGCELRVLQRRTVPEGSDLIGHMLLEIVPPPSGTARSKHQSAAAERFTAADGRHGARHGRTGAASQRRRSAHA